MPREFRMRVAPILVLSSLAGCGGGNTAPPKNDADLAAVAKAEPKAPPPTTADPAVAPAEPAAPPPAPAEPAAPAAPVPAAPPAPVLPATAAEAAEVLDLRKFPLLEGAADPGMRTLAQLHYEAPGKVREAFASQVKELATRGWTIEPNGYVSDESASGTFRKDGFTLSLSISPAGKPGEADRVMVFYSQHGNVDTRTLPRPPEVKPMYESPLTSLYVTEATVEATAQATRERFLAEGWEPYGTAGNTLSFKRNAIEASATVQSAPAQGGKTVIQFGTQLLSHDLPAPPDAENVQYSDSPAQLSLDWSKDVGATADYYRHVLGERGWKATTDNPIEIDWKRVLIFRNEAKDMLELEMSTVEEKTRIMLEYSTAAQVAEEERRFKEEIARREMEKNKPKPKLAIKLPAGAGNLEQEASRIEFTVKKGTAQTAVEAIRQSLVESGWKEERSTLKPMFGDVSLAKENLSVSLGYIETGVLPPEITISGFGVDLEIEK